MQDEEEVTEETTEPGVAADTNPTRVSGETYEDYKAKVLEGGGTPASEAEWTNAVEVAPEGEPHEVSEEEFEKDLAEGFVEENGQTEEPEEEEDDEDG